MEAGPRILLVEDEAMNSMYMASQLRRMGFAAVECVFTGEAALSSAERERPDLALMDINLGGAMSGLEAARRLKLLYGLPIIFLSGYSDQKIREGAESLEPEAFLVKPIDLRELRRLIVSALDGHKPTAGA